MATVKKAFHSFVALAVLLAGAVCAQAQNAEPIVVVSLPSANELTANVDFLAQLGGQGTPSMPSMMLNGVVSGFKSLDKSKPIGIALMNKGGDFTPMVFAPDANAKELADILANFHLTMAPAVDDGGVLKATMMTGQEIFLRDQSGWTFATMSKDATLPSDPGKLLSGLSAEYCIGARVYLKNIPPETRKSAMDTIKMYLSIAAQAQRQQDNPLSALGANNMDMQVEAIQKLLNEADQFTIGWKLDRQAKSTLLDLTFTALPGSQLDQDMQQLTKAKTNFAGFLMPDAAMTGNFASVCSQQEIDQGVATLTQLKQKMDEAIDKDMDLPDDKARAQVKSVVQQFYDVLQKTVKSGKSDGGLAVQMGPDKLQAAMGGYVADGPGLEKAVKNLIELAKGEPKFTEMATVKFDVETHRDVKFHQVSVKLPPDADDKAKQIFGDAVDVYLGIGPDSVYVGVGRGSLDLVKSVIDSSAGQLNKSIPPFQMSIALGPIIQFAAAVNQGNTKLPMIAQVFATEKGKDHILLSAKPISNGVTYRFEVESGILDAVQQIAKMAMGGAGGSGGPGGPGPGGAGNNPF
jgi:hypothetical protein